MNEIMTRAFFDEFDNIQKEAGVLKFLGKGLKDVGKAVKGLKKHRAAVKAEGPMLPGQAGKGFKSHGRDIKKIFQRGAEKAGVKGKNKTWGGVKRVAKSRYGRMGAVAGVGGLATYGAGKAVFGD